MLLSDIAMLMLCGNISGFLAGLLGIGGGMILVPFMILVFNHQGFSQEVIVHMATILFTTTSAVSCVAESWFGRWQIDWWQRDF